MPLARWPSRLGRAHPLVFLPPDKHRLYGPIVTLDVRPLPPSSVPPHVLAEAETLPEAFATLARRWPSFECLAFVDRAGTDQRINVGALWSRARQVQAALVAGGVAPGDIVVVAHPTGVELAAGYFGVMLAGGLPISLFKPAIACPASEDRFAASKIVAPPVSSK